MKIFHLWKRPSQPEICNSKILLGFVCHGGVGDMLIASLYIQELGKIINYPTQIDVYGYTNKTINTAIFSDNTYIDRLFLRNDSEKSKAYYDVFCQINRFPHLDYVNEEKIKQLSPNLWNIIKSITSFRNHYSTVFDNAPFCNTQISLMCYIQGKKRFQVPDINGMLGISEKTKLQITVKENAKEILRMYGLNHVNFITVHRGLDMNMGKDSTKLWPINHYNRLLAFIKKHYKTIPIVQLGVSDDRCPALENIDINLVGKTNFEELKVLVAKSSFHIDCEGGLVHLRHFLSGSPSCVLFGPTSPNVFGYSENINLKSNYCKFWCEWLSPNWQNECFAGFKNPLCMNGLNPEFVFNSIVPYLNYIKVK